MKLYLKQLIYTLSDADIERLKKMDLRKSKIKDYIDLLIEHRHKGIPDREFIMERLGLDENSLKKMRSIALDRCLQELAPEGGVALLGFLSRYRLPELFCREADAIIEEMERDKSTTKDKKAVIYLQAIQGYFRLPYSLFSPVPLNTYFQGFLKNYSYPDKPVIVEVIKLYEIFVLIVRCFLSMDLSEANYNRLLRMISDSEKRAAPLNNKRVNDFARGLRLIVDLYFKRDWAILQPEFEKLVKEYASLNDPTIHDELFALKFYTAYNYIMLTNFKEANKLFAQLEADYKPVFHYFPHVVMRYCFSLLMAGEKAEARRVVNSYFKENILGFDPDGTIMYCIANIAVCLLENDQDKIPQYFELYHKVRNKKDLMVFEGAVRLFEIAWFYQRGDESFAVSQLKKFSRYLKDNSDLEGIKNLVPLVTVLSVVLDRYIKEKISRGELEEEIRNIFSSNRSIAAVIFLNAIKVRVENAKSVSIQAS